jgi:hypothetical protein
MRVLREQELVASNPRKVIDVTELCHANRGMDQQVSLNPFRCAQSEFDVRAVHGITRLKSHDTPPTKPGKFDSQFSGI